MSDDTPAPSPLNGQHRVEVLKMLHDEHAEHARHHEHQRETISSLCAVLAGGTAALLGSDALGTSALWKSDFLPFTGSALILIGWWGFRASAKHHERSRFHIRILEAFIRAIEVELRGEPVKESLSQIRAKAAAAHYGDPDSISSPADWIKSLIPMKRPAWVDEWQAGMLPDLTRGVDESAKTKTPEKKLEDDARKDSTNRWVHVKTGPLWNELPLVLVVIGVVGLIVWACFRA